MPTGTASSSTLIHWPNRVRWIWFLTVKGSLGVMCLKKVRSFFPFSGSGSGWSAAVVASEEDCSRLGPPRVLWRRTPWVAVGGKGSVSLSASAPAPGGATWVSLPSLPEDCGGLGAVWAGASGCPSRSLAAWNVWGTDLLRPWGKILKVVPLPASRKASILARYVLTVRGVSFLGCSFGVWKENNAAGGARVLTRSHGVVFLGPWARLY